MKTLPCLILVALSMLQASAVQPLPAGAVLSWDQPVGPGFSNWTYFVWRTIPPATNWFFLQQVNVNSYSTSNAIVDTTMYGVSGNFQSNKTWYATDIGVAGWPPAFNASTNTVRITPSGGVRVDTNQWTKVSYDMTNHSEWLRFHNPSPGTVLVEHRINTNRPYLFMLYPTLANPPFP